MWIEVVSEQMRASLKPRSGSTSLCSDFYEQYNVQIAICASSRSKE